MKTAISFDLVELLVYKIAFKHELFERIMHKIKNEATLHIAKKKR